MSIAAGWGVGGGVILGELVGGLRGQLTLTQALPEPEP